MCEAHCLCTGQGVVLVVHRLCTCQGVVLGVLVVLVVLAPKLLKCKCLSLTTRSEHLERKMRRKLVILPKSNQTVKHSASTCPQSFSHAFG